MGENDVMRLKKETIQQSMQTFRFGIWKPTHLGLGVYSLGVYNLGVYSLGAYSSQATDFGSENPLNRP